MSLNDEDKKWIQTQNVELRSAFRESQAELRSAFRESQAELRSAFQASQAELRSAFQTSQAELRSALEEKIMDTETRLLTEFHKWASPVELRLQSHAMAIRAIDLELENVKERVTKLEPKQ